MNKIRQPEKEEQRQIVEALRKLGASVYVLGTRRRSGDHPGTMQTPGLPDLITFLPVRNAGRISRLLFIEVKAPGGRLRYEQQIFASSCHAAGCEYLSGGLSELAAYLTKHGWIR